MLEDLWVSLLVFVIGQLIAGAAIWGSIRADIKNMHRRQDRIDDAISKSNDATKEAHNRIDQLFQVYWQSNMHQRDSPPSQPS